MNPQRAPAHQPLPPDYQEWLSECEKVTLERMEKFRRMQADPERAAVRKKAREAMRAARARAVQEGKPCP